VVDEPEGRAMIMALTIDDYYRGALGQKVKVRDEGRNTSDADLNRETEEWIECLDVER
jgi:hypothetical protein